MEALGLDIKLLLAQIINFGILYFVLKKVLFKPLTKMINMRNKKIQDALKNSEIIEKKLEELEGKERKLLEKAREKGRVEREGIIEVASKEKEEIINNARELAKKEIEKGLESIEIAKNEAIKNLSNDYLKKISEDLYKKLKQDSKKRNHPKLKSLLK